jgi:membrane protein DedA with SNARE-associated domain
MKTLSLIMSVVVFVASGYFFVTDFRESAELNYLIYMSLLVTLMLICIVGVMINLPMILRQRRKVKTLIYNSYSSKRIPNKEFDKQLSIH